MSRLLVACASATVGYVVGWLAGQSTRDALALRSLSRPETGASVTVRRSGGLAGSQAVEGRTWREAALSGAQGFAANAIAARREMAEFSNLPYLPSMDWDRP